MLRILRRMLVGTSLLLYCVAFCRADAGLRSSRRSTEASRGVSSKFPVSSLPLRKLTLPVGENLALGEAVDACPHSSSMFVTVSPAACGNRFLSLSSSSPVVALGKSKRSSTVHVSSARVDFPHAETPSASACLSFWASCGVCPCAQSEVRSLLRWPRQIRTRCAPFL